MDAAEEFLREIGAQEHWIPMRHGVFQASYIAWLCGLAAEKQASNEDERAYCWLQHWRWLTANSDGARNVLDRTLERLEERTLVSTEDAETPVAASPNSDFPQGGAA